MMIGSLFSSKGSISSVLSSVPPPGSDVVFTIPLAYVDNNIFLSGVSDLRIIGPVDLIVGVTGGSYGTIDIQPFLHVLL